MARRPLFRAASSFAAILILAAGCGDYTPTAVHLEGSDALVASAAKGPKANVVKMKFSAGSYSTMIGPQGGTIEFGIGKLVFPAGALERSTRITATTDGSNLGVEFGPHGLVFPSGHSPRLFLTTAGFAGDAGTLRIVYVDNFGYVLEEVATAADIETNRLTADLKHFSTYWMAAP
jgi:hypothetical protein